MSQSPLGPDEDLATNHEAQKTSYLASWDRLAELIRQGKSFSGRERNCLFLNTGATPVNRAGSPRFANVSAAVGFDHLDDGRGLALVDWDGDGDLDVWQSNRTGPRVRYLENKLGDGRPYVKVSLEGTRCNRDAIGARVEVVLQDSTHKLVRTLRAGQGFLSQSSKVIHFGLPTDARIDSIRVTWPGEKTPQVFASVQPSQHYRLVQGQARVQTVDRPRRPSEQIASGEATVTEQQPLPTEFRTFLAQRRDFPRMLSCETLAGKGHPKVQRLLTSDRSCCIVLWASWCQPCLEELAQLKPYVSELEANDIDIVCLNVDAEQDRESAVGIWNQLDLPFPSLRANQETMRALMELESRVYYRKRDLPLPCSYLFARSGKLAVINKQPVDGGQILLDAIALNRQRQFGIHPYPGRQVAHWFSPNPFNIANAYLKSGYIDDAKRIAREARPGHPDTIALLAEIAKVEGNVRNELRWREELWQQKRDARSLLGFASVLLNVDPEKTKALLPKLRQFSKQFYGLVRSVAQLHAQLEQPDPAVEVIEYWLNKAPNAPQVDKVELWTTLAIVHQISNNPTAARAGYEQVLKDNPDHIEALNNLAWLLATDDAFQRERERGVQYARHACALTDNQQPSLLDTLATALDTIGDPEAQIVRAKAVSLARARGERELAEKIRATDEHR